jgi:aminoglycoside/choline kinase family phosphotransferase
LDLDFRHTPADRLVDERGRTHADLAQEERRRLAATQGILILRLLRSRGFDVPVILCADLDADQAAYLEGTLGPLQIAPSLEGLARTADRMRAVCRS